MSYIEFSNKLTEYRNKVPTKDASSEYILPLIRKAFGLYVLPIDEKAALLKAISAGKDKNTGRPIRAGRHGEVAGIQFSGGAHTFIIMVRFYISV